MNTAAPGWTEANQALLAAELARLRRRLEAAAEGAEAGDGTDAEIQAMADAMPGPAAIDILCGRFGLTAFERQLLLLCCGVEFDARVAAACARIRDPGAHPNPSFGMALSLLQESHWSALTPARPLRRWCLVEVGDGARLVDSPLSVDERILHFIAGIDSLDARLRPLLTACEPPPLMSEAHAALAARIAADLSDERNGEKLVRLEGDDCRGQADIAAAAADRLGKRLFALSSDDLPASGVELERLQVLWEREALLSPCLLLLQAADAPATRTATRFADSLQAPLIVSARQALPVERACSSHLIDKPDRADQKRLWQRALGARAAKLNGGLDQLVGQFRFSARTIASIAGSLAADGSDDDAGLWRMCRHNGRKHLDDLAERIRPNAGWDDLVLPDAQLNTLKQIGAHLRQRIRVYEEWGFAHRGARGLGVSALFSGESGTGKTLAAEVLANELSLDLYRIDLSSVVSKYIGETEKNLRRVFDAAEDSGALLLFDEADALFGKRSEVKDSHDRYANIEISYLLQRMEAYRGLAILTSNMKAALDRAFQRRLRFVVNFPFPDAVHREAIWRRAFPARTPLDGIDYAKLARLHLPGGNIRSIVLNAAFLAAETDEPVTMSHLLHAARSESAKLDRPLADAETRGWT